MYFWRYYEILCRSTTMQTQPVVAFLITSTKSCILMTVTRVWTIQREVLLGFNDKIIRQMFYDVMLWLCLTVPILLLSIRFTHFHTSYSRMPAVNSLFVGVLTFSSKCRDNNSKSDKISFRSSTWFPIYYPLLLFN